MSDLLAAVRAVADHAAAQGSMVVSLRALYDALGTDQPHHLTIDPVGEWIVTHACAGMCPIRKTVSTAPLISSPHARGRTYQVWLDDGLLHFRDVTP
jgi:hypothetical protein